MGTIGALHRQAVGNCPDVLGRGKARAAIFGDDNRVTSFG